MGGVHDPLKKHFGFHQGLSVGLLLGLLALHVPSAPQNCIQYGGYLRRRNRAVSNPPRPEITLQLANLPEVGTATPDSAAFSGSTLGEAESKSLERLAGFQEASGRDWPQLGLPLQPSSVSKAPAGIDFPIDRSK